MSKLPYSMKTSTDEIDWALLENKSRGQRVKFFAFGGDPSINRYLVWVSEQLSQRYGIDFQHIKINSTTDAVSLMLSERSEKQDGAVSSVDLLWVNGKSFAILKENQKLLKDWVDVLPNYALLNVTERPFLTKDFGIPTEGSEVPWGLANLTFYYNSRIIDKKSLPKNPMELLSFTKNSPGRFSYPAPPEFVGVSFLKQTLSQLADDPRFYSDVNAINRQEFEQLTYPLWSYLDKLHPNLYFEGNYFSNSQNTLLRLFDDEILSMGITFNAANLQGMKIRYDLPKETDFFHMPAGSLSNVHFIAISKFTQNKEAALVVANFLISPEAQAYKASPENWGDKTVLDFSQLTELENTHFKSIPLLQNEENILSLSEFHPSWDKALTEEWENRYRYK